MAWASFDVMDQWKPAYSSPPNPDLFDPKAGRRMNGFLCYGGMAALLAIGIWFTASNSSREEDSPLADSPVYKSSTYEKHFLSDGSSFYLIPNSEVRVAFSEGRAGNRILPR